MRSNGRYAALAGHACVTLALVSATLAVRGQEVARPAPGAIVGIKVFQDGAVEEEAGRTAAALEGRPAAVRLEFGMPETAPWAAGFWRKPRGQHVRTGKRVGFDTRNRSCWGK
jgi:hypothetical protein